MARVDLNIVDRGTSSTKWTPEDVALTAEHLDEVMEQRCTELIANPVCTFFCCP